MINNNEIIIGILYWKFIKFKINIINGLIKIINRILFFQFCSSSLHKEDNNNPVGIPKNRIIVYNISFIIIYLRKVCLKELWMLKILMMKRL